MLNDPPAETPTGFSKYLIFSGVALLVAGLYVGWVFLSRWQANQALEEKAATERRSQDRQTFEMMGGDRFEILGFYADPGAFEREKPPNSATASRTQNR